MADGVLDRLGELEEAVRRASETLLRLREENGALARERARLAEETETLRREVARLGEERRQVASQIDVILKDIAKLDLGAS